MKCKVTNYLVFALALSTVLMSGLIVNAKEPLRCDKTMTMISSEAGEIMAAGPITGDIEGWFVVYNLDPKDEMTKGHVTHYGLRWEIWESESMIGTPFMSGTHKVNSNNKKLEWVAQGVVEDAYGQYVDLEGCIWHAKGIIDLVNFQIVDDYFIMNGPR